jgi:DNA-binding response OmpR family regulator
VTADDNPPGAAAGPAEDAAAAPLRALVVDDDVGIRRLVMRVLERKGFVVDTARDGAEGLEKIADTIYAVVVLDLMMPRVDGAAVLKFLSEHHPEQLPAVIVMTAYGATAVERLKPPPAYFITKPFNVEDLINEVTACVQAATPHSDDPAKPAADPE